MRRESGALMARCLLMNESPEEEEEKKVGRCFRGVGGWRLVQIVDAPAGQVFLT